jgi:hypothetical protein
MPEQLFPLLLTPPPIAWTMLEVPLSEVAVSELRKSLPGAASS